MKTYKQTIIAIVLGLALAAGLELRRILDRTNRQSAVGKHRQRP